MVSGSLVWVGGGGRGGYLAILNAEPKPGVPNPEAMSTAGGAPVL